MAGNAQPRFMPVAYVLSSAKLKYAGCFILTSEERRAGRRARREMRRRKKKDEILKDHGHMDAVSDFGHLLEAADRSAKNVRWKCSVQRYEASVLRKTYETHMKLLNGEDVRCGFHKFTIMERGKLRDISSVHISERVVQRSLSDNVLVPVLTRTAISANMACIEGRGTHAAIEMVAGFLREHYRKHGLNGVVAKIDFHNYFGSLKHEYIRTILEKHFDDQELIEFVMQFVDAFGDVGCGLGSQVSQIIGTVYPNKADHYAKEVLRIRAYLRYMDDTFMIFPAKERAKEALKALFTIYEEMGIEVNEKKTQIIDIRHEFTFLKTQFRLTDSGKVIMRPCRQSITRERRKLKKLKKKLEEGRITFEEVQQQYQSWKGYMKHKMSWRTVNRMDQLFDELFIHNWKGKEGNINADQIQRNNSNRRKRQKDRTKFVACADGNKNPERIPDNRNIDGRRTASGEV